MMPDKWLVFAGIVGAVLLFGWLIYWVYRAKLLEREERRLMIERGMTPPPPEPSGWPAVRVREQELRYQERLLRIEKGMDPGQVDAPNPFFHMVLPKEPRRPEGHLRRGLVTLAVGLGVLVGSAVFRWSGVSMPPEADNWFLFFLVIGPVVALYGAANILYYSLTKNRPSDAASPSSGSPDLRSGS
jgi:hypothetical protein